MADVQIKGCSNIRKQFKGPNDNLLQNIQEYWSIKVNEDNIIQFHYSKNSFRMSFLVTLDTFLRLFKSYYIIY